MYMSGARAGRGRGGERQAPWGANYFHCDAAAYVGGRRWTMLRGDETLSEDALMNVRFLYVCSNYIAGQ